MQHEMMGAPGCNATRTEELPRRNSAAAAWNAGLDAALATMS
jgi:hypothetical protein